MYKLGLIGYPLSHSLSKTIQKAAFESVGLEGSYELLETPSENLVDRIKYLRANDYNGFNVTIPFKIPISLFISDVDEYANLSGSVNTVLINEDKTLKGYNTDVFGFLQPIRDLDLTGKKAVVLGTGGASRAVICGLSFKGIKEIDIYTRNVINSGKHADLMKDKFKKIDIKLKQYEVMESLEDAAIVVNTTPLGMRSFRQGLSPLDDDTVETLNSDAIIYDVVYNPVRTELISKAIRHNKKYITGIDMLIYQGARAFEIWTGQKPNIEKMKIAALEELVI